MGSRSDMESDVGFLHNLYLCKNIQTMLKRQKYRDTFGQKQGIVAKNRLMWSKKIIFAPVKINNEQKWQAK